MPQLAQQLFSSALNGLSNQLPEQVPGIVRAGIGLGNQMLQERLGGLGDAQVAPQSLVDAPWAGALWANEAGDAGERDIGQAGNGSNLGASKLAAAPVGWAAGPPPLPPLPEEGKGQSVPQGLAAPESGTAVDNAAHVGQPALNPASPTAAPAVSTPGETGPETTGVAQPSVGAPAQTVGGAAVQGGPNVGPAAQPGAPTVTAPAAVEADGVLSLGSRGPAVLEVQRLLGMRGAGLTGEYGVTTRKMVLDFQRAQGIEPTGKVGPTTLSALKRSSGANGILFGHRSAGLGASGAQANGVARGEQGSAQLAEQDLDRVLKMKAQFEEVGARFGLPPALLAAIASRETRGGSSVHLDAGGYSAWDGQGFGVMQVDRRYHAPAGGPRSSEHIAQAARILKNEWDTIKRKHPDWPASRQLQAAVVAYNAGPSAVEGLERPDRYTTGGDYSGDVWARARYYAGKIGSDPRVEEAAKPPVQAPVTEQAAAAPAKPAEKAEGTKAQPSSTVGLAAAVAAGTIFERGASGPAVVEIQKLLGLSSGGQTGVYGETTEAAVREFQESKGIQANGRVGPQTLAALKAQNQGGKATIIDQYRMNHEYNGGYCGIATLLTTLDGLGKKHGIDIRNRSQLDRFASGIYQPGNGSSGAAMAEKLREFGEKNAGFTTRGNVAMVMNTLSKGKPVPVGFVSMGGKVVSAPQKSVRYGSAITKGANHFHQFGASGHWATVVGFEGDPRSPSHFLVNDSDTGAQLRMSRSEFERHTAAHEGIWMIAY
jgi:peptidoglycan hydrolase-like protein with peptidoglycan-binding domain